MAAITGESDIMGEQIGTIEIADRHSVVELPEPVIDQVVQSMRKTRIRGRKVPVRRFLER